MSIDVRTDTRRTQLAASALTTLSERGYANTSIRDIAQNSEFSHGVLHYYFKDKTELILEAMELFKVQLIERYDATLASSDNADGLFLAFAGHMSDAVLDDGALHRLWYDFRAQGMFDAGLREHVMRVDGLIEQAVLRIVTRYAELSGTRCVLDSAAAYALIDGLFQRALQEHFSGDLEASTRLIGRVHDVLPVIFATA